MEATIKNTAVQRPRTPTKNMAPLSVKKVKTKMEAKVKTKVGTMMISKGKAKVDRRLHIDGHYVVNFFLFPFTSVVVIKRYTSFISGFVSV